MDKELFRVIFVFLLPRNRIKGALTTYIKYLEFSLQLKSYIILQNYFW